MAGNRSKLQYPNKKQFMITIPKSLVAAKGWKQGDELEFVLDSKGNIVMKKVKVKKNG
ncbi:AbrB/MazE/SpoVT family DNA-binding domain-containing protein [Candidatus Woesearchaeota archaeon]|nr:AbrB/MazE/SpoVT family DNA-binding domain-containing protein [Candidatus Woesearchaeota archaeon]